MGILRTILANFSKFLIVSNKLFQNKKQKTKPAFSIFKIMDHRVAI